MADAELSALKTQVEGLARQVMILEAKEAVRTLHNIYGYYLDMCLYEEVVQLYSDKAEMRFLNGVFKGKAGVRRLYIDWMRQMFTKGHNGPIYGFLLDHLILQDVITVAPGGQSAKMRLRSFLQAGYHETMQPKPDIPMPPQCWEAGVYENEYVKEDGVWKIYRFNYNLIWQANYEEGWAHSGVHLHPLTKTFPEDPAGPDELLPITPTTWPERRVIPFHYPHPVTGEMWKESK